MHVSSVVVVPAQGRGEQCRSRLQRMPGLDVAIEDRDLRKFVVLLETRTVAEQEALLRELQSLPDILLAELACHYFGDESSRD